jgi:DNA-binding NarL/FixJ family response regulator
MWLCDDRAMARPTLLIVDDHEDFRRSAETLLELEGFDVVGFAEDGPSALSAVAELRPDVVLLDVQLPGMDGFEVVRQLRARREQARVVLISSRDRSAYASELVEAPVRGFLAKSELSGAALYAFIA